MIKDAKSLSFKLILSLLLIGIAFVIAWYITKQNYNSIRNSVNALAQPNQANILSNKLFKDIVYIDQLDKQSFEQKLNTAEQAILKQKRKVVSTTLDSLKALHVNSELYLEKIELVKGLLIKRDAIIQEYLKIQNTYRKSDSLQYQLAQFSDFVQSAYLRSDEQIFKLENKISATTYTDTLSRITEEKEPKSNFWHKLFGKKKEPVIKEIQHFILEQLNVSLDTLQLLQDDSIYIQLAQKIELEQKNRSRYIHNLFTKKQALYDANNSLFAELLSHINLIEQLDKNNIDDNNQAASHTIDSALSTMTILLWTFGIIIFVLGIFIAMDLIKNNQYKYALQVATRKAEKEAADKQLFLSNMSHELRSPLQSIIGFTELVKNDAHKVDMHKIEVIEQSSKHLLDVVNHFLDYNVIDQKAMILDTKPFKLAAFFESIYKIVAVQASQKKLQLEWEIAPSILLVVANADEFRLKQICLNLLHNAVKNTQVGKLIFKARLHENGQHALLMLEVIDTGVGIPADKLEQIFLPYEQVDIKDKASGSGLGLTIVKQVVDAFQGKIDVKSTLGKGTSFSVTLPLNLYTALPERENSSILYEAALTESSQSVWVIDDDILILEYYKGLFEQANINFQLFQNPNTVLSTPMPDSLALVLMDIRMPEMSGYDLIKALRQQDGWKENIVFIAVTGQILPAEKDKAIACGFTAVLHKPFDSHKVFSIINTYLGTPVESNALSNVPDDANYLTDMHNLMLYAMQHDMQILEDAYLNADSQQLYILMHTHASRLAQFAYPALATLARKIELQLANGQLPVKSIQNYIQALKELLSVAKSYNV